VDIDELKALVTRRVDAQRGELDELSLRIHSHPELGFEEVNAASWLTQYLKQNGFQVESGICKLPTAFRGSYGQGKPVIALLAEYDALPKLGHACGHNLIATSAIGGGVAVKPAIDQLGGTILVIGTPAEEGYGAKVIMADRGAFKDIDIVMETHPGTNNTATTEALACQSLEIKFFGKAAHAAAKPEAGINALEAMIQSFNAINSLRQHIRDDARIHGIITDGGKAANVIPDYSTATFMIRAKSDSYLDELKLRVINCFNGAAMATGASLEYQWANTRFSTLQSNLTLAQLFKHNMGTLGRQASLTNPANAFGSTDVGNISQLVPTIHPIVAIAPEGVSLHSPQFATAAASAAGSQGLIDAAKAMAMTTVDLIASPEVVSHIKQEFRNPRAENE